MFLNLRFKVFKFTLNANGFGRYKICSVKYILEFIVRCLLNILSAKKVYNSHLSLCRPPEEAHAGGKAIG